MPTVQCATGVLVTYGEKYDFGYTQDNNWNARRASITTGEGTAVLGPAHWLIGALAPDVRLSDAGAGSKYIPYQQIDYVFYGAVAPFFQSDMFRRSPLHTLKLDFPSYLSKELDDRGLLPEGGAGGPG